MQSAVSFAPLRPVGFVNFHGAGRGKACFLRGGAGQPIFPRGGAGRSSLFFSFSADRQLVPQKIVQFRVLSLCCRNAWERGRGILLTESFRGSGTPLLHHTHLNPIHL